MRSARTPWGPWSDPALLYDCPDGAADPRRFCYSAKAHPALAGGDFLIVSYVVNSTDFWQVAREGSLYWPRFVRARWTP